LGGGFNLDLGGGFNLDLGVSRYHNCFPKISDFERGVSPPPAYNFNG